MRRRRSSKFVSNPCKWSCWRSRWRRSCWRAPPGVAKGSCRTAAAACGSCVEPTGRCGAASEGEMSRRVQFKFRLYVAGDAQNSAEAITNLTAICREYLPDRHSIEVLDVFLEPTRALADGIFMTPTLVKLAPAPIRRIIGTLSQTGLVLQTLG